MGVVECTATNLIVEGTALPLSLGLPVKIGDDVLVVTEVEARPNLIRLSCSTNKQVAL